MKILLTLLFSLSFWQIVFLQAQQQRYSKEILSTETAFVEAYGPAIHGNILEAIDKLKLYTDNHSRKAAPLYQIARLYVKQKEYELALPYAQKASRIDHTNKWYPLLEAEILEKLSRNEEAAIIYETLFKKYPEKVEYGLLQAYNQLKSGNPEGSLETLSHIENSVGVSQDLVSKKIMIYKTLGVNTKVIEEYEKLIDNFPEETLPYIELAEFYESMGNFEKARNTYLKVKEIEPDNKKATLALIQLQSNQKTSIVLEKQDIIQNLKSSSISLDQKITFIIPLIQELDPHDENKVKEITQYAEILTQLHPQSAKAQALAGDIYFYSGNMEKAILAYQSSLKFEKSIFQVWEKLIDALLLTQRYEELIETCNDALIYFPNQVKIYYHQGFAYGKVEKDNTGFALLNNITVMAGQNEKALQYILCTQFFLDKKSFKEVMKELHLYQLIEPMALYRVVTSSEISQEQLYELITFLENAPIKDEVDKNFLLAQSFFQTNQFKKALKYIEKAQLGNGIVSPITNYLKGLILEKLAQEAEGEKWKQYAIKQGLKI